jgi:hypothetical protein
VDLKNLMDFLTRESAAHDKEPTGTDKAAVKSESGQPMR